MIDESALASGIYQSLEKCLLLREKYQKLSLQDTGNTLTDEQYSLNNVEESGKPFTGSVSSADEKSVIAMGDEGFFQVFATAADHDEGKAIVDIPSLHDYYVDCEFVSGAVTDGPTKTLAFRRLRYLQAQFQVYLMLNEQKEAEEQKMARHRDFYNVRKVDTHIHHSSCMNCKHLLRFIKKKLKMNGEDVVIFRDGQNMTLAQVFQSLNLTAYDLSIDVFDMHAHKDSFHRFDRFNLKYNPIGEGRLREIFLKTDNFVKGKYLAEVTKEVIADLEDTKYQMVEWRLSIYGHSKGEWDKLAGWVVDNNLYSENVRWLIQVPRLYDQFKNKNAINSFEDMISNIFQPLFEVTKDPSSHPKLHHFLKRVVGFDCVDDESKAEKRVHKKFPFPKYWESNANPPYSYYMYYMYANIASLNNYRHRRGFGTHLGMLINDLGTFMFRPHGGEAGEPDHLVNTFLVAHGINHGITLRKLPALQYLYYLAQIGIAMSPLSNNILFLTYDRNPFLYYFQCGMNVSLSTDDPLQFHYTKEPLIEEYSVAAQIYKLSSADMCEIAKYSVLQSGYEATVKRQWIGSQFHKDCISSNDVNKTNVPHRRAFFRYSILQKEKAILRGQEGVPDELVHSTAIPDNEQLMLKEVEAGISMPEKLCPNCTT